LRGRNYQEFELDEVKALEVLSGPVKNKVRSRKSHSQRDNIHHRRAPKLGREMTHFAGLDRKRRRSFRLMEDRGVSKKKEAGAARGHDV